MAEGLHGELSQRGPRGDGAVASGEAGEESAGTHQGEEQPAIAFLTAPS